MNLVSESIVDFKRGSDPRRSLKIGRYHKWAEFIEDYFSNDYPHLRAEAIHLKEKMVEVLRNIGYDLRRDGGDERLSYEASGPYGKTKYWIIIWPNEALYPGLFSDEDTAEDVLKLNSSSIWIGFEEDGEVYAFVEPYRSSVSMKGPPIKLGNMNNPNGVLDGIMDILDKGFEYKNQVHESIEFQRGSDPKEALRLGKYRDAPEVIEFMKYLKDLGYKKCTPENWPTDYDRDGIKNMDSFIKGEGLAAKYVKIEHFKNIDTWEDEGYFYYLRYSDKENPNHEVETQDPIEYVVQSRESMDSYLYLFE